MCGRLNRGITVLKSSTRLFRKQPSLAVLPLLSLVAVGTVYSVVGFVFVQYGLVTEVLTNKLVQYSALFVALMVSSGFGIFFNAAIVHCAAQYYRGEPTSVRDGLAAAWSVRRTIAKWGLVSATIGTVLWIVEDNVPGAGSLIQSVLNLAWAILTFFIVPVIVLERTSSLRSGLEQSGQTFKQTWGESVTATVGVGIAFLPVIIVGAAGLAYAYFATGPIALLVGAFGAALVVASMVITQVLGMVVRTALYQYAATGEENDLIAALGTDDIFVDQ